MRVLARVLLGLRLAPPRFVLVRAAPAARRLAVVDGPAVEWYFGGLREGVTHLSASATDLPKVVNRLEKSSKGSLNKLRAGSVAVQKRFLCAQCPARYLQRALKDVRRHFGQHLLFDHAEERVRAFRAFGAWLGDVHELAFVPAMDLPETYKYETIHVLQALLKSLDGSDTVVRARSVAGDRLLPTSKWHLHNWRPGPDDFAFFPEKEHLDVHRLAPAVLVGEL